MNAARFDGLAAAFLAVHEHEAEGDLAALARVELDNADGLLLPGMFAEMVVDAPELATAVVPASAPLARRGSMGASSSS